MVTYCDVTLAVSNILCKLKKLNYYIDIFRLYNHKK